METDHCLTEESSPIYQVKDLAGSEIFTESGDRLGVLVDVLPSGGADIFVVQEGKREFLIPARKQIVLRIDVVAKRIEVRMPEGLRELYEGL